MLAPVFTPVVGVPGVGTCVHTRGGRAGCWHLCSHPWWACRVFAPVFTPVVGVADRCWRLCSHPWWACRVFAPVFTPVVGVPGVGTCVHICGGRAGCWRLCSHPWWACRVFAPVFTPWWACRVFAPVFTPAVGVPGVGACVHTRGGRAGCSRLCSHRGGRGRRLRLCSHRGGHAGCSRLCSHRGGRGRRLRLCSHRGGRAGCSRLCSHRGGRGRRLRLCSHRGGSAGCSRLCSHPRWACRVLPPVFTPWWACRVLAPVFTPWWACRVFTPVFTPWWACRVLAPVFTPWWACRVFTPVFTPTVGVPGVAACVHTRGGRAGCCRLCSHPRWACRVLPPVFTPWWACRVLAPVLTPWWACRVFAPVFTPWWAWQAFAPVFTPVVGVPGVGTCVHTVVGTGLAPLLSKRPRAQLRAVPRHPACWDLVRSLRILTGDLDGGGKATRLGGLGVRVSEKRCCQACCVPAGQSGVSERARFFPGTGARPGRGGEADGLRSVRALLPGAVSASWGAWAPRFWCRPPGPPKTAPALPRAGSGATAAGRATRLPGFGGTAVAGVLPWCRRPTSASPSVLGGGGGDCVLRPRRHPGGRRAQPPAVAGLPCGRPADAWQGGRAPAVVPRPAGRWQCGDGPGRSWAGPPPAKAQPCPHAECSEHR
ncbi:uncharacterized protein LOC142863457 [Microcebus murinus]|uniref:uncharacterized protein LOC142863457 n=1 Tax=Microcebus murinus TaxID=30608 RepID=UPI003F6AF597